MIDNGTFQLAVTSIAGLGLGSLMLREFIKRMAGKSMESAEFAARNDIIEDMRTELRELRGRVQELEAKVAKLQDRLVVVRTHALTAYSFVQMECRECPQQQQLLDLIAQIVKDD